jgi:hypothetical protein
MHYWESIKGAEMVVAGVQGAVAVDTDREVLAVLHPHGGL